MTNASIENRDGDGMIDPWAIARKLYQRLPVIALVAILAVGLTAAYVFTVPPIYTAWTRIVVDPSSRKPFEDANAPSLVGSEALGLDTQLLIVSSAAVLEPVVTEYKLVEDPEFAKEAAADTPERRVGKVTEALAKAMTVSREGATYIISIGVKSQSAQKSADLSQAVAKSYLREQQQFQLNSSRQLAEQIDSRLIGLRERVREAEEKVQQFRAEKRLQSAVDGTLLVGQELGGLNTQLVEARSALASATAANEEIQRYFKREVAPTALGEVVNSPRVTQLLEEYSRAVRSEASLAAALLPQHPSLLRAKAEVARISSLVRSEIQAIGEGKKVELDVARQRVANLERQMETLRTSSNVSDQDLIVLRELETEAKSTRAVYENVLGRAKEVANLEQITMPVARIISQAQPPEYPSWPRKKILLALAGFVGCALGVLLVVVAEVWRQLRVRYSAPAPVVDSEVPASESAAADDLKPADVFQAVPRRRIVYSGSPKVSTGHPKR
ncbi:MULTISPECIES: GumC family protein [unclassified Shinella]|uniref:GumC family protein n=1 Tax=Shinella TaxID=323620 RepID=UPI00225DC57C|nr:MULTISPECIES: GumC family protein [unclassified Shinella]MCO5138145.1 GumC family protein [Shinella sp.]MDC7258262.1 GumC family protein [Shinella sp. YE25]CAI0335725.1 conserved hypothetical protein [Rhizobiaceae bacterium]CAK7260028.1 conserved protein of unknown function [Shinella sp. WSC3-e]